MIALVLFICFGLLFGYFATLNTETISVYFGTYTIENAPLYLIVLACLGLGVLLTGLFSLVKSFSTRMAFHKKNTELAAARKEVTDLMKTVHRLELENTRLKTKNGEEEDDDDSL